MKEQLEVLRSLFNEFRAEYLPEPEDTATADDWNDLMERIVAEYNNRFLWLYGKIEDDVWEEFLESLYRDLT